MLKRGTKKAAKKLAKKDSKKADKKTAFKKTAKKKAAPKKAAVKKSAPKKAAKKSVRKQSTIPMSRPDSGKKTNFAKSKKKRVYSDALINGATYLRNNVLSITFTDGHVQEVDFSAFLDKDSTPSYLKEYKEESKFRKFKIEDGNLVWGKDWDLIFPLPQLYMGEIK